MKNDRIPMIQIDDTIISIDCLSEKFCCDLDACKGECCIEGDAGAPVELDEVAELLCRWYGLGCRLRPRL